VQRLWRKSLHAEVPPSGDLLRLHKFFLFLVVAVVVVVVVYFFSLITAEKLDPKDYN